MAVVAGVQVGHQRLVVALQRGVVGTQRGVLLLERLQQVARLGHRGRALAQPRHVGLRGRAHARGR